MCLEKTHKFPKVAWKPITVYKVLEQNSRGLFSVFQHTNYKIGKIYHSRRSPIFGVAKNNIKAEGIHSYHTLEFFRTDESFEVAVECIIPRFSLYYIGQDGDVASGRIIIKNIIEQ